MMKLALERVPVLELAAPAIIFIEGFSPEGIFQFSSACACRNSLTLLLGTTLMRFQQRVPFGKGSRID